ncbi:hypothetical protein G210_2987 [Candida maltosa Xu316]|uniref:Bul1 N-terminal domain-containing protein n=1 Tax=Candida maltosa (strain Xu316) TaxID=1245528 RepID=M3JV19_CANMX|nr:hypothetical protein G210_2987 [Candida maltosa Xu316]
MGDDDATKLSVDETISSILPSYSMFTSTLGRNVTVPETDDSITHVEPPVYNRENSSQSVIITPTTTQSSINNFTSSSSSLISSSRTSLSTDSHNHGDIVADENTDFWKETVLDNVHRLPNLTFQPHLIPESINIEVHYTQNICEVGKTPIIIDPSNYEYKQGDLLNGYILIRNTSNKPIPYEMFYLLFEGNFLISNQNDINDIAPIRVRRFLEMFDFSGSSNDGNINRLVTDERDPYNVKIDMRDPFDGTDLDFGKIKIMHPGKTYKRFFTFRIPNHLLDSECNEHGLSRHVELPPSLGLSRWEIAHYPDRSRNRVEDFGPFFHAVSYGVMARFIGRKSTLESDFGKIETGSGSHTRLVNSKGDEYIILKELTNHFRVVQEERKLASDSERAMKVLENKLMYENLISRIKQKIEMGKQLVVNIEKSNNVDIIRHFAQMEIESAKCRQLYKPDNFRDAKLNPTKVEYYETFLPLVKKSRSGDKGLGMLKMSTPKKQYPVCYIPPTRFRQQPIDNLTPSWNFEIPLDLSIQFPSLLSKNPTIPSIKSISAEFVILTVSSPKLPIPVEFNHDLVFNKQNNGNLIDTDNFENNIVQPFKKYSHELTSITHKLGPENFKLEKQLINDIKCISGLNKRTVILTISEIKVTNETNSKGLYNWTINDTNASLSLRIGINLENLVLKGGSKNKGKSYDRFTLVPDFQSCFMTRMYYVRIIVQLSNGSYSHIKVPIRIQKNM